MKKRILGILLSVSLLLGGLAGSTENALAAPKDGSAETPEYKTGYIPMEIKEIPKESLSEDMYFEPSQKEEASGSKSKKQSAVYEHAWDKYSTYYFYNKMTKTEQALYDKLDDMCRNYLQTERRATFFRLGGERYYYTGLVSAGQMEKNDIRKIANIFRVSNPQYYFLNNTLWTTETGVGFGIYQAFVDGFSRKSATGRVQSQLSVWEREIAKAGTDYEKVKTAHDLINQKVSYNSEFYDVAGSAASQFWEETAFSQTAYSAICMDKTVCAGYSQAFEMLCNGAGIDTVAVTSKAHEWNKVRLQDSWYNVDCTWDDYDNDETGESKILYRFFVRSDHTFEEEDKISPNYYESHRPEDFWNGLLPVCTLDTGSTADAPGVLPEITEKTADPVISYNQNTRTAALSCETPNADIYYSLDGTKPSPASVKCRKYTGKPFTADGTFQIKAVAVADTRLDSSAVQTDKLQVPPLVQIRFSGNGSTSGSMQTITYDVLKAEPLPANKFKRKGYTFASWNTKTNGKGTRFSNRQTVKSFSGRTATLYAQWNPIKYTIKYNLKGGKNSKKNPSYYYTNKTVKLQKATRPGYTFKGWYSDKSCKKKVTSIKKGSIGNKTLYAKWQKKKA